MDQYYFKTPFASGGDTTAIPAATQPSGDVSMTQGFTYDYERDLATDPAAKAIPRAQDNWLYNVITDALRQYQQVGIPEWITSADNGGSPFAYAQGVLVIKSGVVYQSLVAANTGTPGVDADKWGVFPLLNAIAAVTADKWSTPRTLSLTGDVTAALTSVDGSGNKSAEATIAAGAVTTAKIADGNVTGPKLENSGVTAGSAGSPSSVPAVSVDAKGRVTALANTAIRAGNLSQTGLVQLVGSGVDATLADATKALTAAALAVLFTGSASGNWIKLPYMDGSTKRDLIVQWGTATIPHNSTVDVTFAEPFPNAASAAYATLVNDNSVGEVRVSVNALTATKLTLREWDNQSGDKQVYWWAVGH